MVHEEINPLYKGLNYKVLAEDAAKMNFAPNFQDGNLRHGKFIPTDLNYKVLSDDDIILNYKDLPRNTADKILNYKDSNLSRGKFVPILNYKDNYYDTILNYKDLTNDSDDRFLNDEDNHKKSVLFKDPNYMDLADNAANIIFLNFDSNYRIMAITEERKILSLPFVLLVEILARVATSSLEDLFNAKQCCTHFLRAAEDNEIFRRISLDNFPVTYWWYPGEQTLIFLNKCLDNENPEALLRQGLIDYFSLAQLSTGLNYLKKAAESGHVAAQYIYGIILFSEQGPSNQQGLNILINSQMTNRQIWQSRIKIRTVLDRLWIRNYIKIRKIRCCCRMPDYYRQICIACRWEDEVHLCENNTICIPCKWYEEAIKLSIIVKGGNEEIMEIP